MTDPWLYRLDPRTKLGLQLAVVVVAFGKTEPIPLLILSGAIGGILVHSNMSISDLLADLRYLIAFLSIAPILGALQLGAPWVDLHGAIQPGLAAFRVLLLVIVGIAIVRTTPTRELQAAIWWMIPGKPGRAIALGVSLVLHFLPIIRREVVQTRQAIALRGGDRRPLHEQLRLIGIVVIVRLLERTDRVSNAMKARCLSWNPTVYPLQWSRIDLSGGFLIVLLLGWLLW